MKTIATDGALMRLLSMNIAGLDPDSDGFDSFVQMLNGFDLVFLQEVRRYPGKSFLLEDPRISSIFPYSEFTPGFDWSKDYGRGVLQNEKVVEGLATLSKQRFTSSKVELPIIKGLDRWPRICTLNSFDDLRVCNLHLSKHKESRQGSVEKLPEADIYIGDFNMFPEEFLANFSRFENSYTVKRYISYPSKEQTLDYVVLKKGKIKNLDIIPADFSDHCAIAVGVDGI